MRRPCSRTLPHRRSTRLARRVPAQSAQITAPPADGAKAKLNTNLMRRQREAFIYVDYSTPAVLSYSETVTIHRNLQEAITAWLALPNDFKIDALITTNENGESRHQGWEIYRLWGRWDS